MAKKRAPKPPAPSVDAGVELAAESSAPPAEPKRAKRVVRRAAPRPPSRSGRVALIGRPNVGKSTLLNALLGEPIAITSRHAQTTRDRIAGVITEDGVQIVLVDTPGLHKARTRLGARMNQEAREASRDADVIVFITDVAPEARSTMRTEDLKLLATIPEDKPVVLVVNKVDRVKPKSALFPLLVEHAKARAFAAVVPVSALRDDGVRGIIDELKKLLPEGPPLFDDDTMTDKPIRFFVAEFVREQILRKTYQEVPHGVAVVVERFEEGGRVPKIDLAIHVDKETHKRIIIGAGGSVLKAVGTEARARVEHMMGTQVALRLWVRVTPEWYEKDALMRDLGYEPPTNEKDKAQ